MEMSKSVVASPGKSAKQTPSLGTPRKSKPSTPVTSKLTSPNNGFKKSPSKTALFVTPKNGSNGKDIAILHESRVLKSLASSGLKQTPKRDPILQNNEEPVKEFKPSVRRLASADKASECQDETFTRTKAVGEFNHIYNPRSQEPKPQGIKPFVSLPSPSKDENERRVLKPGPNAGEIERNPLLEGDKGSEVIKRLRGKGVELTGHQKKLNDRKHFLAADRGCSSRGEVFRATTFTLGDDPLAGSQTERASARPVTSQELKMRGYIKGVLEYDDCPGFKDHGVSGKCTNVNFHDIVKGNEMNDIIFGRKKTLHY